MRTIARSLMLVIAFVTGMVGVITAGPSGAVARAHEEPVVQAFDCATTDIPAYECEALVALQEATSASAWWANTQWLQSPDVCDKWAGVICDGETRDDPHVVGLLLTRLELVGQIPDELAQLTRLESLILSRNLLSGEIPSALAQLEKLAILDLQDNLLSGEIPSELADMPDLTSLYLSTNSLEGPIPEALMGRNCVDCPSDAGHYGFLHLANNNFSGQLPQDIGRLDITFLDFRANPSLAGPIPTSYPQLGHLTTFYIHGTNVCIPSDPEILAWLETIQTIISTQPDCSDFEYVVSGLVLGSVNQPLDNIWVSAGSDLGAFTDQEGYFEFTVPGGNHTITPESDFFNFGPSSIEISVPPDATGLVFRGYAGNTISGRITDSNGQPVQDIVLLTDTGEGGTTETNGEYVIDMLDDGTYVVEPLSAQFEFVPATRTVTVPPPATGIDFVAVPLSLDPKVWADGPGWSTDIDPEIDDILRDLTPDTVLKFTCPGNGRSATAGCLFANAYVVLAAESDSRCDLFRVRPMATSVSQNDPGAYEAWLKMSLPLQIGRCSDHVGTGREEGSLLSFFAGQEAFLFSLSDANLSLQIAGPTAYISAQGRNTFSVDSQPDEGRTTIAVFSGRVTVTPANPSLAPFELGRGEEVTVGAFDVSDVNSLPQLYMPGILSSN